MSSTNVHDDLLPFLQKNYVLIRKGRLWSFLGGVAAFLVAAGVVSYQAAVSAIKSSSATAARLQRPGTRRPRRETAGAFFYSTSFSRLVSNTLSTCSSSWPRRMITPPWPTTLQAPWRRARAGRFSMR